MAYYSTVISTALAIQNDRIYYYKYPKFQPSRPCYRYPKYPQSSLPIHKPGYKYSPSEKYCNTKSEEPLKVKRSCNFAKGVSKERSRDKSPTSVSTKPR
jgi:hypothetical protein